MIICRIVAKRIQHRRNKKQNKTMHPTLIRDPLLRHRTGNQNCRAPGTWNSEQYQCGRQVPWHCWSSTASSNTLKTRQYAFDDHWNEEQAESHCSRGKQQTRCKFFPCWNKMLTTMKRFDPRDFYTSRARLQSQTYFLTAHGNWFHWQHVEVACTKSSGDDPLALAVDRSLNGIGTPASCVVLRSQSKLARSCARQTPFACNTFCSYSSLEDQSSSSPDT